ncbi:MAG: hypothetical protein KZQ70_13300 [gamma proteobacterium symbiont of Lucinoma myriamae]|nr:hypothetical protein [gamma proteobacterium symbiont of Lucinoma myriamae]MCU7833253.1 hypothetical protein [gamma proteobacterium symbiont of Lucinoma myriamae]
MSLEALSDSLRRGICEIIQTPAIIDKAIEALHSKTLKPIKEPQKESSK